jgi:hypothetical protein
MFTTYLVLEVYHYYKSNFIHLIVLDKKYA